MVWTKFTIETTEEAEECVTYLLAQRNITSIEIEDLMPVEDEKQGGTYPELQPDLPKDEGLAKISFYLDVQNEKNPQGTIPGDKAMKMIEDLKMDLMHAATFLNVGAGKICMSETKEEDWINNWKKYFHSFTIEDILIKPTWEKLQDKDKNKMQIEIDPGVSFGTGKHETTQLCIKQLRKYEKKGQRILDVGCGSGILSIIALKMGAAEVNGTDIDEDCITSTKTNIQRNYKGTAAYQFYTGNLTDDRALQKKVGKEYDIVVANILADIIIGMAAVIYSLVKKEGIFITSGIINFKEEAVKEALKMAGFTIVEVNTQGEWVNVTAKK